MANDLNPPPTLASAAGQSTNTTQHPFLWGVATSGYQSEGGYNGNGQPQNNWSLSEARELVMRTGKAAEFWHRYAEDFQTCRQMGLNSFRLGLEWARIQPSLQPGIAPPPSFDAQALDAYADRIAACRQAGLEPIVTLHHFTHPAWLGTDAWLEEATIDQFVDYVRISVMHINRRLVSQYQLPPIYWYITINEPNILVLNTYLGRQFPSDVLPGPKTILRAYNHLLTAHVLAYNCIHDIYEAQGWVTPLVSLNTYCSDLYWSEKVIWDLLNHVQQGIKPTHLRDYIHSKANQLEAALRNAKLPFRRDLPYQLGRLVHFVSNSFGYRSFDLEQLDLFLTTLNTSPRSRVFDYVAIDYYDPFIAHTLRLPMFSDFEFASKGLRAWLMNGITSKWWDWRSLPEGLHFFCKYYAQEYPNQSLLIAENGMALRRKPDNSVASRRGDQLHRSEFLEAHIQQVQRLIHEGVPLVGYMHWSLTDNYEWGSYTPRFGLFTIDFEQSSDRLMIDHLGDRPSETYARLIQNIQVEAEIRRSPSATDQR
ncbi:glycoside hydrolase family 1 protein [Thermocoleostomius sinensis]|uniref:Family 1 glycosylhydrolase n=1 Tax=Thermocoleostomius sinensis A174 TaxID=2016057 RepID=A0A9E8ZFS7_9CYAN|nr:family 1 glycosylhydrolase [Thermocoleostomius sinensis]WAL60420.1 family 1 glycosylhydrolase [Thermocoleostomius sinensis A174]